MTMLDLSMTYTESSQNNLLLLLSYLSIPNWYTPMVVLMSILELYHSSYIYVMNLVDLKSV